MVTSYSFNFVVWQKIFTWVSLSVNKMHVCSARESLKMQIKLFFFHNFLPRSQRAVCGRGCPDGSGEHQAANTSPSALRVRGVRELHRLRGCGSQNQVSERAGRRRLLSQRQGWGWALGCRVLGAQGWDSLPLLWSTWGWCLNWRTGRSRGRARSMSAVLRLLWETLSYSILAG